MPYRSLIRILFTAVFILSAFGLSAQKTTKDPVCIVDDIVADSINVVEMPDGLWDLIDYSDGVKKRVLINPKPFTVQVYGDKSRNEANARASKVQARFPQYHVRRHYSSPYFRVYLGAFETSGEAQVLVKQVKQAFPAFANEVHWTKTSLGTSKSK